MKSKGELIPCKNIIEITPFKPKKEEENIIKGIVIIWETEEYATKRLKSDWIQQTKVV